MIAIGAFLVIAVAAWWGAPRLLTVGRWQVLHPRAALAAWHTAVVVGLGALGASVATAVATAVGATLAASPASDVPAAVVQTIVGWGALACVGAALVIVGAGSDDVIGAGRRTYGDVLAIPHSVERLDRRTRLITCRTSEPFACAIPGASRAVVVSTGLREILTPAQLAAVVAHERTHLTGQHYVALRLAELNQACLPTLRSGSQLLRATRLLVELIADDRAARQVGAVHLANALARVAEHTNDISMDIRAERLTERRWVPARKLAVSRALPES